MSDDMQIYDCKNGEQVTIEIDDLWFIARVFDKERRELGRFEFDERDGLLKLIWAYLDLVDKKYKHQ